MRACWCWLTIVLSAPALTAELDLGSCVISNCRRGIKCVRGVLDPPLPEEAVPGCALIITGYGVWCRVAK